MKTYYECLPCFVGMALNTLKRTGATDNQIQTVMRWVFRELAAIDFHATPPALAMKIHREIRDVTHVTDPFAEEKRRYNEFASALLPAMRKKAEQSPDGFIAKVRLAIAANIIDFGKNGDLREDAVAQCFDRAFAAPLDESAVGRLRDAVHGADAVLYLCDNAGEIVFDKFFIEEMPPAKVTCAVRGGPVINDATMDDARQCGLTDITPVISNGSDAPGTLLDECSDEFRSAFDKADLVIAKGQGNFETLSDVRNKRIFFLFQIKCPVIARDGGFPVGTFVIKENGNTNGTKTADPAATVTMEVPHG